VVVPEIASVGARQATASARSSAMIRLRVARRTPSHADPSQPVRARRRLPIAREAKPARQSSPRIKGGSLPPGNRGRTCVVMGIYFTVLMDRATWVGDVPLGVGWAVGLKVQSESGGSVLGVQANWICELNPYKGLMMML